MGLAVKPACTLAFKGRLPTVPERTFARLRYPLGGDRPSQTTRLARSPRPVDGLGLGRRSREGSIPRAAPRGLAPPVRCLLPILYTRDQRPMPSCSEGSRGLSVLPQVSRIFTNSAISPGPWSRQRPSRYAFRAGRNLPDKEFRYLRTVIVTAAVYRGLASGLRSLLTHPRNLPAPGRRQTLYVASRLLQSPVFLVNSRLGRLAAAPSAPGQAGSRTRGHPFSRSYGAIVPSSLTMVLPIASVCSTRPPVSVLVRARPRLPRGFSREHGLTGFASKLRLGVSGCGADFPALRPYALSRGRPEPRPATLLRRPVGRSAACAVQECLPAAHRLRLSASP